MCMWVVCVVECVCGMCVVGVCVGVCGGCMYVGVVCVVVGLP